MPSIFNGWICVRLRIRLQRKMPLNEEFMLFFVLPIVTYGLAGVYLGYKRFQNRFTNKTDWVLLISRLGWWVRAGGLRVEFHFPAVPSDGSAAMAMKGKRNARPNRPGVSFT
ncbi:hypothetical protein KLP40_04215 [Hymenobacter sp. NST-14]|uniref:hypothetical protein n=1 Tax=Hymenobacter piscis TaxID=2839984 RepID=UPI001C02F779|nr:hypothetical protein [Hymenobacter piscis]MBT9392359.1 hypothetical protein [Hymenobacter piscis]